MLSFLFIALFLFICDACTKYLVCINLMQRHYLLPLYPYGGMGVFHNFLGIDFCLNHIRNQGGAWGILSSYPVLMFILRLCVIFTLLVYAIFLNKERKRDWPLLLILTGALSNVFDYFVYGAVIDMFHFTLWTYSFPVFNLADIMIFFGVMIWFILSCVKKCKMHRNKCKAQSS